MTQLLRHLRRADACVRPMRLPRASHLPAQNSPAPPGPSSCFFSSVPARAFSRRHSRSSIRRGVILNCWVRRPVDQVRGDGWAGRVDGGSCCGEPRKLPFSRGGALACDACVRGVGRLSVRRRGLSPADTEDPVRSRSSSSEIETMVRLAEPTVETETERDCRLGEATGLVVA